MPKNNITEDMFSNFPVLKGFQGPYRNQYLKGIALGKGIKRFTNIEEAIEAANDNVRCGGITVTRQGVYTLRRTSNLYNSDIHNKYKSIEVTYVKIPIQEPEIKIIKEDPVIIEEYIESKKNKKNPEEIYEIIKYGNQEYYYNIFNRSILNLEGIPIGNLKKGKLIKI